MNAPAATATIPSGFVCPQCLRQYGDPSYHGPAPHAPGNLCLDCWADHWAEFEMRVFQDRQWSALDQALWLVCRGLSPAQAADLVGRHRNALHKWLVRLRKYDHLVPYWLARPAVHPTPWEGAQP